MRRSTTLEAVIPAPDVVIPAKTRPKARPHFFSLTVSGANVNDSCFIGNIYQKQVGADSLPVRVDSFGKLGTEISSRRFKRQIRPMAGASETILALKPVIFQYSSDKSNTAQFGLVAEDVAEVNPDLVIRDRDGKPYSVRYEAVNAMLLNEFLKEHCKNEEQAATIARLEQQIEVLTTGLQKVSAQLATASPSDGGLELSKSAPQTACLPAVALREGWNNH